MGSLLAVSEMGAS